MTEVTVIYGRNQWTQIIRCEHCGSKNVDKMLESDCGCLFLFCKNMLCGCYAKISVWHCSKHWEIHKHLIEHPEENYRLNKELKEQND